MTKDYDPFYPYKNPNLGKVITVSVYDFDTNEAINITNTTKVGDILVDIVGGNECAYFDDELEAFV